jgi:hypothetical protein
MAWFQRFVAGLKFPTTRVSTGGHSAPASAAVRTTINPAQTTLPNQLDAMALVNLSRAPSHGSQGFPNF